MMTEKMRVSASSIISKVAETRATPASMAESVPPGARGSLQRRLLRIVRRTFPVAAVAWAAALPLATAAAAAPHASAAAYAFAFAVYAAGSVLCHQLPQRSFHLWGA